jgi:hypothetical protein
MEDHSILRQIENPKKSLALFAAFPANWGVNRPELFSGFQSDGLYLYTRCEGWREVIPEMAFIDPVA